MNDNLTERLKRQLSQEQGQQRTMFDALITPSIGSQRTSGSRRESFVTPVNPGNGYVPPGYRSMGGMANPVTGWEDESTFEAGARMVGNALYGLTDGVTMGLLDMGVKALDLDDELSSILGDDKLAERSRMVGNVASIIVPYMAVAKAARGVTKAVSYGLNKAGVGAFGSTKLGVSKGLELALGNRVASNGKLIDTGESLSEVVKTLSGKLNTKKAQYGGFNMLASGREMTDDALKALRQTYDDALRDPLKKILGGDDDLTTKIIDDAYKYVTSKDGWKHVNSIEQAVAAMFFRNVGKGPEASKMLKFIAGWSSQAPQLFVENLGLMSVQNLVQRMDEAVNPEDYINDWGYNEYGQSRFVGMEGMDMVRQAALIAGLGSLANRVGGGLDKKRLTDFWERTVRPQLMKSNMNKYTKMAEENLEQFQKVLWHKIDDSAASGVGMDWLENVGIKNMQLLKARLANGALGKDAAMKLAKQVDKYDSMVRAQNRKLFYSDTAKDLVGSTPRIVMDGILNYMFIMPDEVKNGEDNFDLYLDILHGAFLAKARGTSMFDFNGSRHSARMRDTYHDSNQADKLYRSLTETYNLNKEMVDFITSAKQRTMEVTELFGTIAEDPAFSEVFNHMDSVIYEKLEKVLDQTGGKTQDPVGPDGNVLPVDPLAAERKNTADNYDIDSDPDYQLVKSFYDTMYLGAALRKYVAGDGADDGNQQRRSRIRDLIMGSSDFPLDITILDRSEIKKIADGIRSTNIEVTEGGQTRKRRLGEFDDPATMIMELTRKSRDHVVSTYRDNVIQMADTINKFITDIAGDTKQAKETYGIIVEPRGNRIVVKVPVYDEGALAPSSALGQLKAMLGELDRLGIVEVVDQNGPGENRATVKGVNEWIKGKGQERIEEFDSMIVRALNKIVVDLGGGPESNLGLKWSKNQTGGGYTYREDVPFNHADVKQNIFLSFVGDWNRAESKEHIYQLVTGRGGSTDQDARAAIQSTMRLLQDSEKRIMNPGLMEVTGASDRDTEQVNRMLADLRMAANIIGEVRDSGVFSTGSNQISVEELATWHKDFVNSSMGNIFRRIRVEQESGMNVVQSLRLQVMDRMLASTKASPVQLSVMGELLNRRVAFLELRNVTGQGVEPSVMKMVSRSKYNEFLVAQGLNEERINEALSSYDEIISTLTGGSSAGEQPQMPIRIDNEVDIADIRQVGEQDQVNFGSRVVDAFAAVKDYIMTSKRENDVQMLSAKAFDLRQSLGAGVPKERLMDLEKALGEAQANNDINATIVSMQELKKFVDGLYKHLVSVNDTASADQVSEYATLVEGQIFELETMKAGMVKEYLAAQAADDSKANPVYRSEDVTNTHLKDFASRYTDAQAYLELVTKGGAVRRVAGSTALKMIREKVVPGIETFMKASDMYDQALRSFGRHSGLVSKMYMDRVRDELVNFIADTTVPKDVTIAQLMEMALKKGDPQGFDNVINTAMDLVLKGTYTHEHIKERERYTTAAFSLANVVLETESYSLSAFTSRFGVYDSPAGMFSMGSANPEFLNRLQATIGKAMNEADMDSELARASLDSQLDEIESELFAAAKEGTTFASVGLSDDALRMEIRERYIPNILKQVSNMVNVDQFSVRLVDHAGEKIVVLTPGTTAKSTQSTFMRFTSRFGQGSDAVRIFDVSDTGTFESTDADVSTRRHQDMFSLPETQEHIARSAKYVFDGGDASAEVRESIRPGEVTIAGITYDTTTPKGEEDWRRAVARSVEAKVDAALNGLEAGVPFVFVPVSPGTTVAFQRTKKNIQGVHKALSQLVVDFDAAVDASVKNGTVTSAEGDRAKAAFRAVYAPAIVNDVDAFTANAEGGKIDGSLQAMIRGMHFFEMNPAAMIRSLATRSDIESVQEMTKYNKYANTVESLNSKEVNNVQLYHMSRTKFANDPEMQEYVFGLMRKGARVAVYADESDADGNSTSSTAASGVRFMVRKGLQNQLDRAVAQGDKLAEKTVRNFMEFLETEEGLKRFASLDASAVNGATFMSTKMARVMFGINGNDIGDDIGGVKGVFHHVDTATGMTMIGKQNYFYDERVAEILDAAGIDYMLGESAAKEFTMGVQKIMPEGEHTDTLHWMQSAGDMAFKDSEKYVTNIPMHSVKVSYSKVGKNATYTHSLTNFLGAEQIREFVEFTGLDGVAEEYSMMMSQIMSGNYAGIEAARKILQAHDIEIDDVANMAAAVVMLRAGAASNNPAVMNTVLRKLTGKMLTDVTGPKPSQDTGHISWSSVLRPSFDVDMPVYATKVNRKGEKVGDYVQTFGGMKISHEMGQQAVRSLNDLTYVATVRNRDYVIVHDKQGWKVVDPADASGRATAKNMVKDAELKNMITVMESLSDFYNQAVTPGSRLAGHLAEGLMTPKLSDVYSLFSGKDTDSMARREAFIEFLKDRASKKTGKSREDADKLLELVQRMLVGGKMHIAGSDVRIPRKSPSDVRITKVQGILGKQDGNVAEVNAFDLTTVHQGDFDVDTIGIYMKLPSSMVAKQVAMSALVMDTPAYPEPNRVTMDMFNNGNSTSKAAGSVRGDGMYGFREDKRSRGFKIGQIAKIQRTATALRASTLSMQGVGMVNFDDPKQLKAFTLRMGVALQSALDDWKNPWEALADDKFLDMLLFGQKLYRKDGTEIKFKLDVEENEGVEFMPLFHKKGPDGTPVQGDGLSQAEKEVIRTVYREMAAMQAPFRELVEDGEKTDWTYEKIRQVRNRATEFFQDPSAKVFKKLMFKHRNDPQMRDQIIDLFTDNATPEEKTRMRRMFSQGVYTYSTVDDMLKDNAFRSIIDVADNYKGDRMEAMNNTIEGAFLTSFKDTVVNHDAANTTKALVGVISKRANALVDFIDLAYVLSSGQDAAARHIIENEAAMLSGDQYEGADARFVTTVGSMAARRYYDIVSAFVKDAHGGGAKLEMAATRYGVMMNMIEKEIAAAEYRLEMSVNFRDLDDMKMMSNRVSKLQAMKRQLYLERLNVAGMDEHDALRKLKMRSYGKEGGFIGASDKPQFVYRVRQGAKITDDPENVLIFAGVVQPGRSTYVRAGQYVIQDAPLVINMSQSVEKARDAMAWNRATSFSRRLDWFSNDADRISFMADYDKLMARLSRNREQMLERINAGVTVKDAVAQIDKMNNVLIGRFFAQHTRNNPDNIRNVMAYMLRPHVGTKPIDMAGVYTMEMYANSRAQLYLAKYIASMGKEGSKHFEAYKELTTIASTLYRGFTDTGNVVYNERMSQILSGREPQGGSKAMFFDLLSSTVLRSFHSAHDVTSGMYNRRRVRVHEDLRTLDGNDALVISSSGVSGDVAFHHNNVRIKRDLNTSFENDCQ